MWIKNMGINDVLHVQGSTIPINQARPNRNLTFTKKEPIGWEMDEYIYMSVRLNTNTCWAGRTWLLSLEGIMGFVIYDYTYTRYNNSIIHINHSSQSVRNRDSLELPSNDAGLEDSSLPSSWKHSRPQTCSGESPHWQTGSVHTRLNANGCAVSNTAEWLKMDAVIAHNSHVSIHLLWCTSCWITIECDVNCRILSKKF